MENGNLKPEEESRLDSLLESARRMSYLTFTLCGISFLLLAYGESSKVKIPEIDFEITPFETILYSYYLILVMSLSCVHLYSKAYPWLTLDVRRVPFPWIGPSLKKEWLFKIWLMLPMIFSSTMLASASTKNKFADFWWIPFLSISYFLIAPLLNKNIFLVLSKEDERGGKATFSIFLLNWMHLLRALVLGLPILTYIFIYLPNFSQWFNYLNFKHKIGVFAGVYIILRGIGAIRFVYRFIDKLGTKLGFPEKSQHYS